MKSLIYIGMLLSLFSLVLSLITKYSFGPGMEKGTIAGIGPAGYLDATVVLLLICANLALLELLKNKQ